jgi:hypothetical protein
VRSADVVVVAESDGPGANTAETVNRADASISVIRGKVMGRFLARDGT